jgi:hypothetical protein
MAEPATWTCPACHTANNEADATCASCGRPRPAETPGAETDTSDKPVGYDGQELDVDLEVDRGLPPLYP